MKKMICILLAALLLLGCAACGSPGGGGKAETPDGGNGGAVIPKPAARGLNMTVSRDTGALSLTRLPLSSRTYTGDAGKWTIFVYLCGTDLESYYGSATYDLIEMLDGVVGDGVRFVVQTGGAEEWWNDAVEAGKLQRYLIENEDILLVDEQPNAGMGRGQTLTDFLRWGAAAYPSEYMGVVLWDHGGGSITGVCFDETDGYDSISLRELDAALLDVCSAMERKYDFVGFDACLMGTGGEHPRVLRRLYDRLRGDRAGQRLGLYGDRRIPQRASGRGRAVARQNGLRQFSGELPRHRRRRSVHARGGRSGADRRPARGLQRLCPRDV